MSIEAMSWALEQDLPISSAKFVLVCLANYANQTGICYPSQTRLCKDTGQDRKTVLANIARLIKAGLLRDTEQRIGATKSVIVYKILGIPESSTRHYVYRTFEPRTGEFYIGKRSFDGDPRLDEYLGSGRWVLEKLAAKAILAKEIVSEHMSSPEAIAAEMQLQRAIQDDPLCKNDGTPKMHRARAMAEHAVRQDREKRDSLPDEASPLFPASSPKNGGKLSQKRDTEPLGTVSEPIKEKPAPKRRMPAGFFISEAVRTWAAKHGFTPFLEAHWVKFLGHVDANIPKYANWDAAFMNCVRDDWGDVRRKMIRDGASAPASADLPWWKSAPGIERRGAELNVPRGDEAFPHFKARVFEAAGQGPWNESETARRVVSEVQQRASA